MEMHLTLGDFLGAMATVVAVVAIYFATRDDHQKKMDTDNLQRSVTIVETRAAQLISLLEDGRRLSLDHTERLSTFDKALEHLSADIKNLGEEFEKKFLNDIFGEERGRRRDSMMDTEKSTASSKAPEIKNANDERSDDSATVVGRDLRSLPPLHSRTGKSARLSKEEREDILELFERMKVKTLTASQWAVGLREKYDARVMQLLDEAREAGMLNYVGPLGRATSITLTNADSRSDAYARS